MPNNNRSKKSREWTRAKALANGMRDAQGISPYCQKCPCVDYCDNVFYNAKGMTDVWCADNPNEKRKIKGNLKFWNLVALMLEKEEK